MRKLKIREGSEEENFYGAMATGEKIPRRELKKEILNKFDPEQVVDSFEQSVGIKKKQDTALNKRIKPYLFNLKNQKDEENLEKLMNDPKYRITYWKDSFNQFGDFVVFCVYEENLDMKSKEEGVK